MDVLKRNNVNIVGNVDAPQTIVFGHGFGLDQTTFAAIMEPFENDYRIVLFDNVGGGKSDMAAFSFARYNSLHGYVADMNDIFQALNLKDVIYVGHSVNGMVGLLTSLKHPEYFSRLLLLGASPRYLNDPENGYVGGFTQDALEQLYQSMAYNYFAWASGFSSMVMGHADRPELAAAFAQSLSAIRPDVAQSVAKAIFESDHREDIKKVSRPVLIVQTSDDVAEPEVVGHYMHANIPGSELTRVHTEGHFPHISAPTEVIAAIRSFV
jgi:sigma-B regulation protein RsbQ